MIRKPLFVYSVVALLGFSASFLLAEQGWFDRFFSHGEPQVLRGVASKPPIEPPAGVLALQDAFAQVVEQVKPAVVNISAVQIARVQANPHEFYYGDPEEFFYRFFGGEAPRRQVQPQEFRREGTGSGVIIDPDGYVLTNSHVVQGADELTVTLSDNKSYQGKVVGLDPRTDLAVVRIKETKAFPYVQLGDSSKSRIGDWVLAFGSPFGLQQTVTSGIISAIRQSLSIEGKSFRNLLQTDAAINRGNSGGPLVNLRGELIGINTAIYAPTGVFSGIGFAIPVNDAKAVLKDLIEKGFVERSWIGVELVQLNDAILVNQVLAGGPAAKAGLLRGDAIVEFDGTQVDTVIALQDVVGSTAVGRTVSVRIIRDGQEKKLNLKTEAMPH